MGVRWRYLLAVLLAISGAAHNMTVAQCQGFLVAETQVLAVLMHMQISLSVGQISLSAGTAAHWEAQPPVVAQRAAAALRTRPLPQPTASSLVVESFFLSLSGASDCKSSRQ